MITMSLYRACIWKVSTLLKRGYWKEANGSQDCNPFSFLPSSIVDELTSTVIQLSSPGTLKITDLYHLLTSRRIEHFKLDEIILCTEDLVSIFMSLSVASHNLRSLILRNVTCSDRYCKTVKYFREEEALECLIKISPQLESFESCFSIDLKVLRCSSKLKVLKLHFPREHPIYNFLEEDNGRIFPNSSLSYLEVLEEVRTPIPYLDLVPILKYCTALTHVNVDISRSLEFLHSEELYEGSLTAQYKLQKCMLGTTFVDNGAASHIALHIATLTCPEMKDVDLLANDHETIYALSDFKQLSSLLIQWELTNGGNFQLGIQPMLERIGPTLKNLHLLNFFNIDFAVIAVTCPDLETLKVEYQSEYHGYETPPVCFKHLKSLHVELMELDIGCSHETLLMLLSHCSDITSLHLDGARSLNDYVLNRILAKNSMTKLKEAVLFDCSLSEDGIRNLISHLSSLEFLHFSTSQVPFEEAANIVHEVNPHVILVADDNF